MQEYTLRFPVSIKSCETCKFRSNGRQVVPQCTEKHVIPCRGVALVAGYSACQPHPPRDWAYILRGIGRGREPLAILRLGALFLQRKRSRVRHCDEQKRSPGQDGRGSPKLES